MSQLGTPYSPPPPYAPPPVPPPSPPTSDDIPGWMVLLAAGVCMALAGLLGFVVLNGGGDSATVAPPPRHHFPKHWNHRIAPLARIAAKDRGLGFEHPVAVRFLKPPAFRKSLAAENGKITHHDRVQIDHEAGLLRALGLLSGKVDLLHAVHDADGAAVDAYYSFRTKSITVRGRTLSPAVKATLVHELTHVLQDQHFRIGHRLTQLQKAKGPDTSAYDVLDAIVEGDADRVETIYHDSLGVRQRQALDAAQHTENSQADSGLSGVPKIVVAMLSSPYALGVGLTSAVAVGGGNAAVDRILRNPPTHDSVLLDPYRQLTGTAGATRVRIPAVRQGEKKFESGEFGALSWYLALAARIPTPEALDAAEGWGGDAYVAYQHGGTTCARMTFAGKTATDTSRMYSALRQWALAAPGGAATVSLTGGRVHAQSCDPGTAVRSGSANSVAALSLVATRNGIANGLVHTGAPLALAHCVAGRLVEIYSVSQLNDPAFGRNDPTVQARVRDLAAACR